MEQNKVRQGGTPLPNVLGPGELESPSVKAIRVEIERMAVAVKTAPDEVLVNYLSNFWQMLPGSDDGGQSAFSANFQDCMDSPFRETFMRWDFNEKMGKFSDKFLSLTPRQFLREVAESASECQVSAADVQRWHDLHKTSAPEYDPAKFMRLILPVYVRLRERGYNHFELTS
jgi:hypothetical protein